jgi:hypothetical protein
MAKMHSWIMPSLIGTLAFLDKSDPCAGLPKVSRNSPR